MSHLDLSVEPLCLQRVIDDGVGDAEFKEVHTKNQLDMITARLVCLLTAI